MAIEVVENPDLEDLRSLGLEYERGVSERDLISINPFLSLEDLREILGVGIDRGMVTFFDSVESRFYSLSSC